MALTPEGSDPSNWSGTHIEFTFDGWSPTGKTYVWIVTTKGGIMLGVVKWFARWRKYCFFPAAECVFEEKCLGEIAEFITMVTREHKAGI